MDKLMKTITVLVFIGLALRVGSERVLDKRGLNIDFGQIDIDQMIQETCRYAPNTPWCSTTTAAPSTAVSGGPQTSPAPLTTTTTNASPLEHALWCRLNNGSYLSHGLVFMYSPCVECRCTESRNVVCATLQCMTSYCIDDSTPITREGECCTQCAYEQRAASCMYNGIKFPHSTIVKTTSNNIRCWCQNGTIECRKSATSAFASLDIYGDGTAVYLIVVIVLVVLFVGTLLCCSCTVFYYYYYQRNQEAVQQAYDQYVNNGGWQAMNEDGVVIDSAAAEKQAEAENAQYDQAYPTGSSEEFVPPPYAIYNGQYTAQPKA